MTFTQEAKNCKKAIMLAIKHNQQIIDDEKVALSNAERDRLVSDAVDWLIDQAEDFKDCGNAFERYMNAHEIEVDGREMMYLIMDEHAKRIEKK